MSYAPLGLAKVYNYASLWLPTLGALRTLFMSFIIKPCTPYLHYLSTPLSRTFLRVLK